MKTSEFISNNKGYTPDQTTYCSSVMQDTNGNFFSYGLHYPLLFKLQELGLWVLNIAGYSVTTAKHIGWARSEADIKVKLLGSDISMQAVLDSIDQERAELVKEASKGITNSKAQNQRLERVRELDIYKSNILRQVAIN